MDVAISTDFRDKLAKMAYSPSFVALAFPNGLDYRKADFKRFMCDDLATSYKNFVKFGPATPEIKRVVRVRTSSISSLAMFAWRRHC